MGYYGCPCCDAQNFRAALRRTLEILTAATRSGPPSCQPIGGRGSGRESGHFLEIASLHPPLAALGSLPTGAECLRNDGACKECGVRRHTWVPPYRNSL